MNNNETYFKMIEFLKGDYRISNLFAELKITTEEIIENALYFLEIKEAYDEPETKQHTWEVNREDNKLVFKKQMLKNKLYFLAKWREFMYYPFISDIYQNNLISNLRIEKDKYKRLANEIQYSENNLFINSKGIEQPIGQMIANYYAYNLKTTIYVDINDLHKFLINRAKNKDNYSKFLKHLETVDILVIDSIGLEKKSDFLHFEILQAILKTRHSKRLKTIFISFLTFEELIRHYRQIYKDNIARIEPLIYYIKQKLNLYSYE